VPDIKDIEKIEKMLEEIGETELEIGEAGEKGIGEEKEIEQEKVAGGEEEAETTAQEGEEEALEEIKKEEEGDFSELIKDIEIGLTEEKELEEKLLKKREEEARAEEVLPAPEEPGGIIPEEEVLQETKEPDFGKEELPQEAELEEEAMEEGFDLPGDFDMGDPGVEEGPVKEGPVEELLKGVEKEKEVPEEAMGVEEPDFEAKPPEPGVHEEAGEEKEAYEPSLDEFEIPELEEIEGLEEEEKPPIEEEGEVITEEVEKGAEEPAKPVTGVEEELKGLEDIETEEEVPQISEPGMEEFELSELEKELAMEVSLEETGEEEKIKEEAPAGEAPVGEAPVGEAPFGEAPVGEAPAGETPVGETPVGEAPAGEAPEEQPAPVSEFDIELSEEDIVLIKTKLKQLSPHVASRIRDLIVNISLSMDLMRELLNRLIKDEPEVEIVRFIEEATGKKLIPKKRLVAVPPVLEKPRRFAVFAENIGPLIRIAGLFISILAILGIIFMIFLYKPIKSNKHYREGIEYIRNEYYPEAERSFQKAKGIYEKVKEYDNYGFEYLMSGNYDAAEQKFIYGVELDKEVKNLDIREHLAKLYNILHKYGAADELYDILIEEKPTYYTYKKLKGRNLIDWGIEDKTHLEEAYTLFREELSENQKNSDPLFQMLYIDILQEDTEKIDYIYSILKENHPHEIDKQVYTELASFYISRNQLDPVWDIMLGVINSYPDYPIAYYIFSLYNKEINNKKAEESLLHTAIAYERKRELIYPWETRDRKLLSNAYNNLGELYAGMEIPGKTAEAISYFKEAIEINGENKKAYFNLAQAYFYEERNFELAVRYYENAKSKGYENNDLNYNLGLLYYYRKSFNKALKQWSELDEKMPNNPNLNFAIGSVFLHMEKYNSALGEFLILSETYDELLKGLGEIKPWIAYHKRMVLGASSVYNNLGVAYQKLFESTGNLEYQKDSLVYLYKAGELADIIGTDWGTIQYNINYIVHPNVIRSSMAINDNINSDYRFVVR